MSYSYASITKKEWKELTFKGYKWAYLVVGDAEETLIMFPGGLRRPVYGGSFIQELSRNFRVLIPIYPQISDMKVLSEGFIVSLMAMEGTQDSWPTSSWNPYSKKNRLVGIDPAGPIRT